jgi:molybdopterin-synthase adenylyltransferase
MRRLWGGMSTPDLADARFARQRLLSGIGAGGLELVRNARIHVVGGGNTAGPALVHLAQAGVGAIYVDDGADVDGLADGDGESWMFAPDQVGRPRTLAALDALRAASALVEVRPFASDLEPTATLICVQREAVTRKAAERARQAGLPHVVALANGDGGAVISIPSGAPCFRCAFQPGARLPVRAGAASALGSLAAVELLLLVARALPGTAGGRRIDLTEGWPSTKPTARLPGCDCFQVL